MGSHREEEMQGKVADLERNGPLALVREVVQIWYQLLKGKRQKINVSHKTMLNKVMEVLKARSPPVFTEIDCGDEGVKILITLDLSTEDEERSNIVVVEGPTMKGKYSAENCAAMVAFKHLEERCNIEVCDFSTRVARSFGQYNTYKNVNEAIDSVDKMLNKFDMAVRKCKELALDLESREVRDRLNENLSHNAMVYEDLGKYLWKLVKSFSIEASAARARLNDLEIDRIKHHKRAVEKTKSMAAKGYSKKVILPSKHLLDFVLCYFGFDKATYSNGPHRNGAVKAVVKFKVPYMEHLKFCGNLNVKGIADNSANAEETAAYKALLLIEENFKVKILDLNHEERVEAETIQKMLVKMLDGIITVGEGVKIMWEKLANALKEQHENSSYEADSASKKNMAHGMIDACKYCADGMETVVQETTEYYAECWGQIDKLDNITGELGAIKIRLDIV